MKVIACPCDDGACGHYRIRQPAAVLAKTEPTVQIRILDGTKGEGLSLHQDKLGRIDGAEALDCDVLVIQRAAFWWAPQAIPHWQRQGIRVVVEIDDDFSCIHPRNGAYHALHPKSSPHFNFQHLQRAAGLANLVTVTTPALAERYASHGRVRVLPNYVSKSWLDIPRRGNGLTVGWAGNVGVHPDDLQVTRGGVNQALGGAGARLLNIGSGDLVAQHLDLLFEPEVTGYVEFDEYPQQLARFDVGIVPLADTRFNAAKSWLKGLEYAALGIPFVASNVAEYVALENRGIGTTVPARSRNWRQAIRTLLTDHEQREWVGSVARERVRNFMTIEGNAWQWADAWQSALEV